MKNARLRLSTNFPDNPRRVTDITSFEKHSESSSGHTLTCCLNLVKYRFKNMLRKESLNRSSTVILKKLRRVKREANFVSSGSQIVKRIRRRKYDPLIIQRTKGLVLGPSSALYRSFLKHCTLTYKAVRTIWWDLSKSPQRRQGTDPRPLWLLVGTPSVLGPELASWRAEHSLLWRIAFIYFWSTVLITLHVCVIFYGLSALVCCWSSALIRRIIYRFLNACLFDYTAFAVSGKVGIP